MSFEISGKLIEKYDTVVISDRFKKRELVLEKKESTPNGFEYVETIKFQLTQDKCDMLDSFNVGDDITIQFNIKGKRWEKDGRVSYFNNLDAWRIEKQNNNQTTPPASTEVPPASTEIPPAELDESDDLPF
ncbi:MAG: DUF3127 domain-containing protein [Bacteroidales bacterium]|nr:DUF3127 domain-containing protein [Bacteroidales bacterium]RLD37802.1 MAG: hypothetical protein DRI74_05710 [Bacteroidota bacterium]